LLFSRRKQVITWKRHAENSISNKKPTERPLNGDDYIRRVRKEVAKRQLERAAKRSEKRPATEEKVKQEEKPQKRT